MSNDCTAGPRFGGWLTVGKLAAVLGGAALMLGAHHSNRVITCDPATCPPPAPTAVRVEDLGSGHPGAMTLKRWSPVRTFRRVAASEWGRSNALDSASLLTVLKINRVDQRHARHGQLLVPDVIGAELGYSPFPDSLPELARVPKFILVSRQVQAFGAYENGALVRWGPTSTGKAATPTDSGLFFTNWKSRRAISTDDPSWVLDWYVNFISQKGVAFHEYGLPGRPASHGCVRLLEADAEWLYRWADQWVPGRGPAIKEYGTPVLVMGDYDYDAPAPWLALAEDPYADRLTAVEIEVALLPYLETLAHRVIPSPNVLAASATVSAGS
jgi:hypothetical protein